MNERIKLLAEQAGLKVESWMTNPPKPFQILGSTEQFEKFAELIVRECARVAIEKQTVNDIAGITSKNPAKDFAYALIEHFGVKE